MRLFARLFGWLRRKPQQAALGEQEAYERCHGANGKVTIVTVVHHRPRLLPHLAGDYLRRCFEERLEGRRAAHP